MFLPRLARFVSTAAFALSLAAAASAQTLPATQTNLTLGSETVANGTAVTLSASVTGATGPVTVGQVVFCDVSRLAVCTPASANLLDVAQLTGAGSASLKLRLGSGAHTLLARFIGTTAKAASSSAQASLTVTAPAEIPTQSTVVATPLLTDFHPSIGLYGLAATVTAPRGEPAPTGNVNFQVISGPSGSTTTTTVATAPLTPSATPPLARFAPAGAGLSAAAGNGVVADFNEDGFPDLATSGVTGNAVTLSIGVGDGTFLPPIALNGACDAGATCTLATADFNGDGHADLAVLETAPSGAAPYTVQPAYGTGSGLFTLGTPIPLTLAAGSSTQILVGDFNGDGRPDLLVHAVGTSDGGIAVLLQQPDGSFRATYSITSAATFPSQLSVADVNGDGKTDLLGTVAAPTQSGIALMWFASNGDGTFAANSVTLPFVLAGIESFAVVADFSGDGISDVGVVSASVNPPITLGLVLVNDGKGNFTPGSHFDTDFFRPNSVSVADVNGDGLPDLVNAYVVEGFTPTPLFDVWLNQGQASFSEKVYDLSLGYDPLSTATPAIAADLNGDGLPDLVYQGSAGGCCQVLINQSGWGVSQASVASLQIPVPGSADLLTANYAAQGNFLASVSPAVSIQGTPVQTTLTLTASPENAQAGQAVTLTATLSPYTADGYSTDGEQVSFYGSNTAGNTLFTAPLKNGVATVVATSLPLGNNSVGANYGGDSAFTGADSNHVPVVVTPAGLGNAGLLGTYVFRFSGTLPAQSGGVGTGPAPGVAAAGFFIADGSGTIVQGEEDLNSGVGVATNTAVQGSYTLSTTGVGTLHLVTAGGVVQDFAVVLGSRSSTGTAQKVALLGLGSAGSVLSGVAAMQAPGYTSTGFDINLSGAYTLYLNGETACQGTGCTTSGHLSGSVGLLGSLVVTGQSGTGVAVENIGGIATAIPGLSVAISTPDSFGRITATLNSSVFPRDEPLHFAGYIVSGAGIDLLSIDAHANAILLSGALVQQ